MQSEIQLGDVFAAGAKLKVAWFRAQAVADPEVWNKGGGRNKEWGLGRKFVSFSIFKKNYAKIIFVCAKSLLEISVDCAVRPKKDIETVIPQRKIPVRDWSKSRHVSFTNTQCCPRWQHWAANIEVATAFLFKWFLFIFFGSGLEL